MNLDAVRARADLNRAIRQFFEERSFIEVETPLLVRAAGTDPYLDPVPATLTVHGKTRPMQLHTSPEFAMKGLVAAGLQRIYQLCHVWRDGEQTARHNPEFTILEWYRAGVGYEVIIDDVETLVGDLLGLPRPFRRVTMREAWLESTGVDPVQNSTFAALRDAVAQERRARGATVVSAPNLERWDEVFFDTMLTQVEPWIAAQGAVFVTQWPAELAALARRCAHDERVAERFELYVDGVELANGFGELTDPVEQRTRFESDNETRRQLGKPEMPMPEAFLTVLESGLPQCSGVALGVDRLLMLQIGATQISQVLA